ncbi:uncharacterized protein DS421_6g182170 [Arachis hypogaea]|nr:uncharacterized protein DS421_6g182170 [Arachis hypogaea]
MTNQGSIVEKVRAEEITREENVINDDNSISEKERGKGVIVETQDPYGPLDACATYNTWQKEQQRMRRYK